MNVPEPPKTYKIINKNNSYFSIFYRDYLENNMLLIFIIFIIIIFLTIRYYTKDIENEYFENKNNSNKKKLIYKKKISNEKNNLKKYKKKLDLEKEKIISIIDELSNINYEIDSIKYQPTQINKINQANESNQNNKINEPKNINFKLDFQQKNFNDIKNNLINNVSSKLYTDDTYNLQDKIRNMVQSTIGTDNLKKNRNNDREHIIDKGIPSSKIYYDINKKLNENDLVEGMYVEPPYI